MVPSPRKHAPPTPFDQTWDDNDAAFFDPGSLPVGRIPRGWERKREVKRTEEGREKKIWRRFNLRSRAADQPAAEEEEEEYDARSRAVKKQQHMSPKAMEKTSSKLNGKKRAFKATRWDRRKSVLPRKKIVHADAITVDAEEQGDASDDAQDATNGDLDDESFTRVDSAVEAQAEPVVSLLPEGTERRGTFTFHVEAGAVDDIPDYESMVTNNAEQSVPNAAAEDATLAHLFKSPVKEAPAAFKESAEIVEYPELPQSESEEVELATHAEPFAASDTALVSEYTEVILEDEADVEARGMEGQHDQQEMEISEQNTESAAEVETCIPSDFDPPAESLGASSDIDYPRLPTVASPPGASEPAATSEYTDADLVQEDVHMSESLAEIDVGQVEQEEEDITLDDEDDGTAEEEFTEASLQLDILRNYQDTLRMIHPPSKELQGEGTEVHDLLSSATSPFEDEQLPEQQDTTEPAPVEAKVDDITDGLTLSFSPAKASSAEPTERKLHSPPPLKQLAKDDANMTIALDDDTALLKDFLSRAAASKAEKAAVITHRRESLQNRRDSDVVRHALASPRKVLEEKDPNSPSKHDNEMTLDLSQNLTLNMDNNALASPTPAQADCEETSEEKAARGSRRSSRTKKSRLPAPPTPAQAQATTPKIAIRRPDGTEHVTLKKSDAQELASLTRTNTRKNKQGAFGVTVRLMKLAVDAGSLPPLDESTKELIIGKNIRWDEQLAYYQEIPETLAEAESVATPDELGMPEPVSTPSAKPKSKVSKSSTPKIRRVRGLGTANGTPAKGLLAPASLLPDDFQEEKEAAQAPPQQIPKPKASRIKKMTVAPTPASTAAAPSDTKLPSLDIAPVGVQPTKERKSRLAAPKKVTLPQPAISVPSEGKENTQRPGIGGATPKKGIPAPKVIIPPSVGMESGLPRRRGRKL